MSEATERVLSHVLSVEWAQLPGPVQQAAKTFLHDALCAGVAGRFDATPDVAGALAAAVLSS